jgi:hypothetical protein
VGEEVGEEEKRGCQRKDREDELLIGIYRHIR